MYIVLRKVCIEPHFDAEHLKSFHHYLIRFTIAKQEVLNYYTKFLLCPLLAKEAFIVYSNFMLYLVYQN